jgi:hypothetical protein
MKYTFLQKINNRQIHLKDNNREQYYIASLALSEYSSNEILVFLANENAEITSFVEVDSCFHHSTIDDWAREFCGL